MSRSPVVHYGWYVCVIAWCPSYQRNELIKDLLDSIEGGHLYRLLPVCHDCGQDMRLIGRPPTNPPEEA